MLRTVAGGATKMQHPVLVFGDCVPWPVEISGKIEDLIKQHGQGARALPVALMERDDFEDYYYPLFDPEHADPIRCLDERQKGEITVAGSIREGKQNTWAFFNVPIVNSGDPGTRPFGPFGKASPPKYVSRNR